MKIKTQIAIVLLFSSLTLFGQTKETKRADTFFENLAYWAASEAYAKLAETTPTEHVLKRLGDSYYYNVQMEDASTAYGKLFTNFPGGKLEQVFRYAQSLRSIGDFKASDQWMEKFHQLKKGDSRGLNFTNKDAVLSQLINSEPAYEVVNLRSINTKYSDFGVTDYGNTILFSSPRERNPFVKLSHTRNEKNFLDIYKVLKEKITTIEGDDSDVRLMFSTVINSKYHESSVAFSPDRKTMYFTRNNYNKGVYREDKKGYNHLKIYTAKWNRNKWDDVEEVPFNSDKYSVGHPTVSNDGKKLYFSSDMPGGLGETDLYEVAIYQEGSFGVVQNLGPEVNTESREMFPFIAADNTLYFSSDGHFGIGALDVFSTKKEKGKYTTPINLKSPVNSKLDDFSFSINPLTKQGYLSSNRAGGLGDDDIYSVLDLEKEIPTEESCRQVVTGTVKEKKFKTMLAHAVVSITDEDGVLVKTIISDSLGAFTTSLPCNKSYRVSAAKEYYMPDTSVFKTTASEKVSLNLLLSTVEELNYNDRDELIIRINPIYFDNNSSVIRRDASIELDKIVSIMKKYPKLIIRSSSHTSATSSSAYNLWLSDRRAKKSVLYIISKGISANRITGKGYGETQLTNKCVDNDGHTNTVNCSEEEHQANRRTEFVIVKK